MERQGPYCAKHRTERQRPKLHLATNSVILPLLETRNDCSTFSVNTNHSLSVVETLVQHHRRRSRVAHKWLVFQVALPLPDQCIVVLLAEEEMEFNTFSSIVGSTPVLLDTHLYGF